MTGTIDFPIAIAIYLLYIHGNETKGTRSVHRPSAMAWTSPNSATSRLFSGDPIAILVAFLVAVSLPLCLHLFLYRTASRKSSTPVFVLLGVSGAGKTSLVTLVSPKIPYYCADMLSILFYSFSAVLSPPIQK